MNDHDRVAKRSDPAFFSFVLHDVMIFRSFSSQRDRDMGSSQQEEGAKRYKSTLNLPKTEFPMKARLSQREPELLQRWEATRLYERIRERAEGRDKFILRNMERLGDLVC